MLVVNRQRGYAKEGWLGRSMQEHILSGVEIKYSFWHSCQNLPCLDKIPNSYLLSISLHTNYISVFKSYDYLFGVKMVTYSDREESRMLTSSFLHLFLACFISLGLRGSLAEFLLFSEGETDVRIEQLSLQHPGRDESRGTCRWVCAIPTPFRS